MADDIRQILMAKHCPNFVGFSSDTGMPLAEIPKQEHEVLDIDCMAIAPNQDLNLAPLMQKIDAQNTFVQQGFEHLIKQSQSFDSRLVALEQRQVQPIAQPVQYQQADLMPVLHQLYAQQQGMMTIANQNSQTQLAIAQMASVVQKLAERPAQPTVVNHYVDNTVHNDNHSVEIHGDNYGSICTDGVQRNGVSFLMFMGVAILTMIVGSKIYGK